LFGSPSGNPDNDIRDRFPSGVNNREEKKLFPIFATAKMVTG
jgi:hypothetical protein